MRILRVLLLIIVTSLIVFGCRGERVYNVIIENQTSETVFVILGHRDAQGTVLFNDEKTAIEPLEIISTHYGEDEGILPVRIFNQQEELVFSENFSKTNMVRIDKHTFKAVIPSMETGSLTE